MLLDDELLKSKTVYYINETTFFSRNTLFILLVLAIFSTFLGVLLSASFSFFSFLITLFVGNQLSINVSKKISKIVLSHGKLEIYIKKHPIKFTYKRLTLIDNGDQLILKANLTRGTVLRFLKEAVEPSFIHLKEDLERKGVKMIQQ